jgi:lipid II:glycine glycyltransferase (peptidoglycan interpeptide bridge formation enzyme)
MAVYREVPESDKELWNKAVTHPMQSWEWGEFRKQRQPINRLGVYEGQKLVKGFLVTWTKIKGTSWQFGYIPMGPLPSVEDIQELRQLGKGRKALGIRMEPDVQKMEIEGNSAVFKWLREGRHLFKPKTFWLNLTLSEEEMLKRMHPKGRYNIKVAKKHEVEVKEDSGENAVDKYLELMFAGTAKRQRFYAHNAGYHRKLWEVLHPAGIAYMFAAKYKSTTLAQWIIFKFKEKIYYAYGAFADEHREVMAPTLMLWETARWGKQQGCKTYDLWGAEEGKGYSRFKEQFGPDVVEMAGTWDLPIWIAGYRIFRIAEEWRWKILRLIK